MYTCTYRCQIRLAIFLHVQLPFLVRAVPKDRVFEMRLQLSLLWDRYFSTVQSIVDTTLEVNLARKPVYMCGWVCGWVGMGVGVGVHVWVCMHACVCVHVGVGVWVWVCVGVGVGVWVGVGVHACMCVCACVSVCAHVHVRVRTCVSVCARMHVHGRHVCVVSCYRPVFANRLQQCLH